MAIQNEVGGDRYLHLLNEEPSISGLQLVKDDPPTQAPERNHFADAPEIFNDEACAPEAVIGLGPRIAYEEGLVPISLYDSHGKEIPQAGQTIADTLGRSKKHVITLSVIAIVAIAAIAVGIGLGFIVENEYLHQQNIALPHQQRL